MIAWDVHLSVTRIHRRIMKEIFRVMCLTYMGARKLHVHPGVRPIKAWLSAVSRHRGWPPFLLTDLGFYA